MTGTAKKAYLRSNLKHFEHCYRWVAMCYALCLKFLHNADLRQKLIETGLLTLHEKDGRQSSYWTRRGGDMLGKMLMEVRAKCFADSTSTTDKTNPSLRAYLEIQRTALEPLLKILRQHTVASSTTSSSTNGNDKN